MTAAELAADLAMAAHPEGGWYRETWRSVQTVDTPQGQRNAGTAILYLLGPGERSALHRIQSDEVWFHHRGVGLLIHIIEAGQARCERLDAARPQLVVPAGAWFGALPADNELVLVGCAVAPGFDFADFDLARAGDVADVADGPWRQLLAE
ncbi:MAG: cupin domain-containing protein [Planctomycetota bacterium]|nr:cupin domain-containing protein [Planctomycetota bacterium]